MMKLSLRDYGFPTVHVTLPDEMRELKGVELLSQLSSTVANAMMKCRKEVCGHFRLPQSGGNIDIPYIATVEGGEVKVRVEM